MNNTGYLENMKNLIKENILGIKTYEPGKPIEVLRKELNIKGEISKLASNENPLGPSPLAISAIKKSLKDGNLYPENSCFELRNKLADQLGVSPHQIGIGNGAAELINLMGMAFLNPEDTLIMSVSSFIQAKLTTQIMNSRLIEVPLANYRHDLNGILKAITRDTKLVYLDNPMNPIGTTITRSEVSGFMKKIPEDVIIVFDQAYYEYVSHTEDYPDTLKFVKEGRNVILVRTFSKLYGLAGFRVGYCIAKEEFINAFKVVKPPFSVNRAAQIGAAAALDDKQHIQKTKAVNEAGKRFLYENFERMGIFYIPSETNFVTIDLKTDVKKIFEELQKRSVIVRPLSMYGKPTFLRVTIGTQAQNQQFINALNQIYQGN